jgi:hypothetical protein
VVVMVRGELWFRVAVASCFDSVGLECGMVDGKL